MKESKKEALEYRYEKEHASWVWLSHMIESLWLQELIEDQMYACMNDKMLKLRPDPPKHMR